MVEIALRERIGDRMGPHERIDLGALGVFPRDADRGDVLVRGDERGDVRHFLDAR